MSAPHPLHDTVRAGKCGECGHHARYDEVTPCRFCPDGCGHHLAASPYGSHDPLTPPGSEAALQAYSDALEDAVTALKDARDAELEAQDARDKAKYEATLSAKCPQPGVYDGVRITVAYRDAWVARATAEAETAYRAKKVVRQAAQDHLDKLNSQRTIAQTIAKSVTGSYQGTGDRW